MRTLDSLSIRVLRGMAGEFGYRPAARKLGLSHIDLYDLATKGSVSRKRKAHIAAVVWRNPDFVSAWLDDALQDPRLQGKQENTVRAALRVPPYWTAWSPAQSEQGEA